MLKIELNFRERNLIFEKEKRLGFGKKGIIVKDIDGNKSNFFCKLNADYKGVSLQKGQLLLNTDYNDVPKKLIDKLLELNVIQYTDDGVIDGFYYYPIVNYSEKLFTL